MKHIEYKEAWDARSHVFPVFRFVEGALEVYTEQGTIEDLQAQVKAQREAFARLVQSVADGKPLTAEDVFYIAKGYVLDDVSYAELAF